MNITVSPAGRGRYHARLDDRLLCTSYTPFFAAARVLKDEGVPLQTPLTMTHAGSPTVCMRMPLGEAANLTVREDNGIGPVLRAYTPYPFSRIE